MKIQNLKNNLILASITITANEALANKLQAAAQRGKTEVMLIAQTGSVIGIVAGGLLMSLGAGQLGKMVLVSGIVGACAIFGGPALIEVLKSVFGA
jgi:type IV secretory pathway VirB2 component (pilin)